MMKIKNIKLEVETDEQNQYILNKLLDVNKGFTWYVYLYNGSAYYDGQGSVNNRAICSVWKGFRYLVIDSDGDLILCAFEDYYNKIKEKEITFEEFKKMVECL
jgi:MoaA/NifB/PqqE/SkfB family radical SAM enzyme